MTTEGHLRTFEAIPSQVESAAAAASAPSPDWSFLFAAAGLEFSQWSPVWKAPQSFGPFVHKETRQRKERRPHELSDVRKIIAYEITSDRPTEPESDDDGEDAHHFGSSFTAQIITGWSSEITRGR